MIKVCSYSDNFYEINFRTDQYVELLNVNNNDEVNTSEIKSGHNKKL